MGQHQTPAYLLQAPPGLPSYCTPYSHIGQVTDIRGGAVVLVTSHMSFHESCTHPEVHKSVSLKVYHSPFEDGEAPVLDLGAGRIRNWCVVAKEYASKLESHRKRFGLESRIIDPDGARIGEGVFFQKAYCAEAGSRGRFGGSNRLYREGRRPVWEEIPSSCVYVPPGAAVADMLSQIIAPLLEQHISVHGDERRDFHSHLGAGIGELLPAYLQDIVRKPEQFMRRCHGVCHAKTPLVPLDQLT